jgi:hypothetical protein
MLRLIIAHHETCVDDAGDPTQQREQKTEEKAEDAAGHQHGDGRKTTQKK